MRGFLTRWLLPAIALWALSSVAITTLAAVRRFDIWRGRASQAVARPAGDPYAALERALVAPPAASPARLRDPFALAPPPAVLPARPVAPRVKPPAGPPPPQLTAIVWSATDPRAVIWWDGRSYSVRTGQVFGSFRVTSITRGLVVLEQDGRPIALQLKKGE